MGRDLEARFDRYRRKGDLRALERVFDRTARDLLALAQHLVRDVDDAEDLVQATFVTAIDRAHSFDRSRALRPWLSGILAHKAANLMRSRARRGLDGGLDGGRVFVPPGEADPLQLASEGELDDALAAALGKLGAPYQEVLEAYLVRGERPEEIARRLDRAPGTVRAQVTRGLEKLRRLLPIGVGAGLVATTTRGLGAVKEAVLAHAGHGAVVATAQGAPLAVGLKMGSIMLGKKTALVGAAVVLASAGYLVSEAVDVEAPHPSRAEAAEVARPNAQLEAGEGQRAQLDQATPEDAEQPRGAARVVARQGRVLITGSLVDIRAEHGPEFVFRLSQDQLHYRQAIQSYSELVHGGGSGNEQEHERASQLLGRALLFHAFESPGSNGGHAVLNLGGLSAALDPGVDPETGEPAGPVTNFSPSRTTVHADGSFVLDVTEPLQAAGFGEAQTFELIAKHDLYFEDRAEVTFAPLDLELAAAGEDVIHEVELTPQHAALLSGVARRVDEEEAGIGSSFDIVSTIASSDPSSNLGSLRVNLTEGRTATLLVDSVFTGGSEGQMPIVFALHRLSNPYQVALFRAGEPEPVASQQSWGDDFEFKIKEEGEFTLVIFGGDRPPVSLPVELQLLERIELEEEVELPPGPVLAGRVEDYGAYPNGGLELEARRLPRQGDLELDWLNETMIWNADQVFLGAAVIETSGDGTFEFHGFGEGGHEIGLRVTKHTTFSAEDVIATREKIEVPLEGLKIMAPVSVVELTVLRPEAWPKDKSFDVSMQIMDPQTGLVIAETSLDDGTAELLTRPEQPLEFKFAGDDLVIEDQALTSPPIGDRRPFQVRATHAPGEDDQ